MKKIYIDNGSTSFPKAPNLGKVMGDHIDTNGLNVSRGSYREAYSLSSLLFETRSLLCEMFQCESERNVIFIPGATYGINQLLRGLLSKGDHILTSSMEHNAVARPLHKMSKEGILWDVSPCNEEGLLSLSDLESRITEHTKVILLTHCSNVCGSLLPLKEVGELCKKHNILFLVDAAQSAGVIPIKMTDWNIHGLVVPGHKALLGPQGIGALLLRDPLTHQLAPVFTGGTGSESASLEVPEDLPDRFEAGTLNIPGIVGLHHSLTFIKEEGMDKIREKEKELASLFIKGIEKMDHVKVVGTTEMDQRNATVSLVFDHMDSSQMSFFLEQEFGIMTRCGLQCSPMAHKTLGTYPEGTLRFSFGYFNKKEDVEYALSALEEFCS